MNEEPFILLVGGADTGRAPIAAALLRRLLASQGHPARVESAGVLGHDEAPVQVEARNALATLGIDLSEQRARSLSDELAAGATLLLTVDSGTLLVLQARLRDCRRCYSLAQLAGVRRDIPDPFRMQIGAWLTYAHEIEQLLQVGLPRIVTLAGLESSGGREAGRPADSRQQTADPETRDTRPGERLRRLLAALAEFPELFDWPATRQWIEHELEQAAVGELGPALAALLRALLTMSPAIPTPGQVALLQEAASRLAAGPRQDDITNLSNKIAIWHTL